MIHDFDLAPGEIRVRIRTASHVNKVEVVDVGPVWTKIREWWEDHDGNITNPPRTAKYRSVVISSYRKEI